MRSCRLCTILSDPGVHGLVAPARHSSLEQSPALWGRSPENPPPACALVGCQGGEKEELGGPGGLLSPQSLCSVGRRDPAPSPVICSPAARWRSERREAEVPQRRPLQPCRAPSEWMDRRDPGPWGTQRAPAPTSGAPAATCLQRRLRVQGLRARGAADPAGCASHSHCSPGPRAPQGAPKLPLDQDVQERLLWKFSFGWGCVGSCCPLQKVK